MAAFSNGEIAMSGSAAPAALHPANITGSPGSTWAGVAAILGVVTSAMSSGLPTTQAAWIAFGVSIVSGVGAIFSKA